MRTFDLKNFSLQTADQETVLFLQREQSTELTVLQWYQCFNGGSKRNRRIRRRRRSSGYIAGWKEKKKEEGVEKDEDDEEENK